MTYLILTFIPLALLVGIFAMTGYEARRGVRLFAPYRTRLDEQVDRVEFILTHVDFSAFLRDLIRHIAHRIAHDSAHLSLLAVRAVERSLTRVVRYLRTRRAIDIPPRENAREFVQTLSDFKDQLKATPPEIPDIY
ncbi:MAG: hypothetical protein WC798_03435 [Candidatus Paceibacterota bacterium]|jgi:hypothetical protein